MATSPGTRRLKTVLGEPTPANVTATLIMHIGLNGFEQLGPEEVKERFDYYWDQDIPIRRVIHALEHLRYGLVTKLDSSPKYILAISKGTEKGEFKDHPPGRLPAEVLKRIFEGKYVKSLKEHNTWQRNLQSLGSTSQE